MPKHGVVRNNNDCNGESTRRTYLSAAGSIIGASALASGTAVAGCNDHKDTETESSDREGIDECITIDESGAYELTEDLEAEDDEACIVITADDVSLNGNEYTISGEGSGTGILIESADDVSAENIELENLERGIEVTGSRRVQISNITAINSPVELDQGFISCVVRDSTFNNSDIEAIAGGGQVLIIGNTIRDAPGNGIFLEAAFNATVIENTISGSEAAGIALSDYSRSQIIFNESTNNGGPGIDLRDSGENTVYLNEVTDNAGAGVVLRNTASTNNDITDNNLSNNDGGPCDIGEDPTENTFSGNNPECEEA